MFFLIIGEYIVSCCHNVLVCNKKCSSLNESWLKVEISFPIPWNGCTALFWTIKRLSESLFIDSGFYDNDHYYDNYWRPDSFCFSSII